jgi:hypothetical protein
MWVPSPQAPPDPLALMLRSLVLTKNLYSSLTLHPCNKYGIESTTTCKMTTSPSPIQSCQTRWTCTCFGTDKIFLNKLTIWVSSLLVSSVSKCQKGSKGLETHWHKLWIIPSYLPTYNVCIFWAQNNLAKGLAKLLLLLLLLLLIFVEIVENWKPLGFFTIASAPTQDVFRILILQ